jgi:hypothetical protein
MLDDLLDIFERDHKKSSQRTGGLRGRLASMLGDSRAGSAAASSRNRNDERRERDWDDDDRDRDDRDDGDRYDDRRSSRKRKREVDLFDFGD